MSCLVGMVLSIFVGKQVSYKTALVAGLALCAVGGTMPAFCNATFTIVIIARIIYGFGFSVLAMRNPIIAKAVGEEESAKWIGYGMSIANISSVVCIYKRFQARESGDNNFFNGSAQWRCSRRSVSDTVLVKPAELFGSSAQTRFLFVAVEIAALLIYELIYQKRH